MKVQQVAVVQQQTLALQERVTQHQQAKRMALTVVMVIVVTVMKVVKAMQPQPQQLLLQKRATATSRPIVKHSYSKKL